MIEQYKSLADAIAIIQEAMDQQKSGYANPAFDFLRNARERLAKQANEVLREGREEAK